MKMFLTVFTTVDSTVCVSISSLLQLFTVVVRGEQCWNPSSASDVLCGTLFSGLFLVLFALLIGSFTRRFETNLR